MPRKRKVETVEPQATRNFVIPGCSVVIRADSEMTTEEFFTIALNLAGSNPGAKLDFWIELRK